MRRGAIMLGLALLTLCGGCDRRRHLSDFHFSPNLTMEQVRSEVGTPSRVAQHWVAYELKEGGELRLYFLGGVEHGNVMRTLSQATLYSADGTALKNLFEAPPTPEPPASQPFFAGTQPAIGGAPFEVTLPPTTAPTTKP